MVLCKNCKNFKEGMLWETRETIWFCLMTEEEILCDADDRCDGYVPLDDNTTERSSDKA